MEKFHQKQRAIIDEILDNDNPTDNEEYHKHYMCFDTIPIAFTDIEMIFDEERKAIDWFSDTGTRLSQVFRAFRLTRRQAKLRA